MIVPYEKLSSEALRGLIEEFVTRPGTDTGYTEGSLEENVEMVMMQLKLGYVLVVYVKTLKNKRQNTKYLVKCPFSVRSKILA